MDSVAPTGGQAVGGDGHQARPFQLMEGFAGGIGAAAAAIRHGGDGGMAPPLPIADAEQVRQNELRPGADPHLEQVRPYMERLPLHLSYPPFSLGPLYTEGRALVSDNPFIFPIRKEAPLSRRLR